MRLGEGMRLEGMDEFRRKAAALKVDIEAAARAGVAKAGMLVERAAKHNCPVATGHLRRSIHTVVDLPPQPPRAEVGTNVEYAPYVEMGWRGPAKKASWLAPIGATAAGRRWLREHGFVTDRGEVPMYIAVSGKPRPPRPYLLPAFEAMRERGLRVIRSTIIAAINRAAAGR